jgi:hypothetical protein
MIKKIPILMILFFLPVIVTAQKWSVSGEIFYGTFKMKSMREFQTSVQGWQLPFEYQIVDKFPSFAGYNLLTRYDVSPRTTLGVRLQYVSTGGRVDYGDYSGQITHDQLLHAFSIGLNSTIRITKPSDWQGFLSFTAGTTRTSLNLSTTSHRSDLKSTYNYYFRSYNYFFNPAIKVGRKISSHLMLYATAGYDFQIHRTLRAPQDDRAYLKTSNGRDVIAEWDGVRLGAGISYQFALRKKNGNE